MQFARKIGGGYAMGRVTMLANLVLQACAGPSIFLDARNSE
jgi:hypothetical protein